MTEFGLSAKKRLVKDIVSLSKSPLTNERIYYYHDEDNIKFGFAMIIGPKDTPYEDGIYLFRFIFPYNYPISPPKVEFMTFYGKVRFHPNLYRNGKVCLSILNTWKGESWTSSLTIRSILLTIQSLLTNNALTHEPGFTLENHKHKIKEYDQIITYANIAYMINSINIMPPYLNSLFGDTIIEHLRENREKLIEKVEKMGDKKIEIYSRIYNFNLRIDLYNMLTILSNL
jgi:ubiquitin-protein ligase